MRAAELALRNVPTMPDAITITEEDQGKTVHAQKGEELSVTLAENRTTGFRWHLEPHAEDVLALESNDYERPTGGGVGAGGTRRFRFRAAAKGKTALCFRYRRPWAAPEKAGREFSIDVVVN